MLRLFPQLISVFIFSSLFGLFAKKLSEINPAFISSLVGRTATEFIAETSLFSLTFVGPMLVAIFLSVLFLYLNLGRNLLAAGRLGTQENEALRSRFERQSNFEIESLRREYRQRAQIEADQYIRKYLATDLRIDVDKLISKRIAEELKVGAIRTLAKALHPAAISANEQERLLQFLSETLLNTRARILESAEKSDRSAMIFRNAGLFLLISGLLIAILRVFGFLESNAISYSELLKSSPLFYVFLVNGPVIGLILFIEFLALLFFRLYRRSEEQLKYFSNEAVNLDLRFAAANSAIHRGEAKDLSKVIQEFASTDRNPILTQGQKTIAHLHSEAEKDDLRDVLALFSAATEKAKSVAARSTKPRGSAKK